MGKYLRIANKNEFETNDEAKKIIGQIIKTWNNKIADQKEKLDTLDEAAKTGWFNSIEIKFDLMVMEKQNPIITAESVSPIGLVDKIFPELSDSQLDLIPFCWVFLEPLGYKYERMREVLSGIDSTEIEIELFQWSLEIVNIVNRAVKIKSALMAEEIMDAAYDLACEKLDKGMAKDAILQLQVHLLKEIKKKEKNNS
ncbi:MAG: hypothetical protein P4L45_04930 [Ignavibacteriaceae bacterium]|nr:hypothetical protein [Ignavibacteriaceae bacterium]